MKILAITGSTGSKSGSSFLRIILKNIIVIKTIFPEGIRLLVRDKKKLKDFNLTADSNIKIYEGNLEDVNYLDFALKNVDTIVHIAGITYSKNICSISAKNGVKRIISVHTTGIYSKYKKAGETYRKIDDFCKSICKNNNINLNILRPTMIYGNITDNNIIKFIKMVDKLPLMPIIKNGKYKLQPVHYEDLANAYYEILINEEKTFNQDFILSGGNEISLKELLKTIGNKLDKKVYFINCPFCLAYIGSWFLYIITFRKKDYREKVQRLCESRVYSHEKASEVFGYNPRNFEEGIVDEINMYKEVLK